MANSTVNFVTFFVIYGSYQDTANIKNQKHNRLSCFYTPVLQIDCAISKIITGLICRLKTDLQPHIVNTGA